MARIRIAQKGWAGANQAEHLDEVTCGIYLMWIEIDGTRISADMLGEADVHFGPNLGIPRIDLCPFGAVEIVYLGKDGQELGSVEADAAKLAEQGATFGYHMVPRPEPTDLETALRERDRARAVQGACEQAIEKLQEHLGDQAFYDIVGRGWSQWQGTKDGAGLVT